MCGRGHGLLLWRMEMQPRALGPKISPVGGSKVGKYWHAPVQGQCESISQSGQWAAN